MASPLPCQGHLQRAHPKKLYDFTVKLYSEVRMLAAPIDPVQAARPRLFEFEDMSWLPRVIRDGATDFLAKPVDPSELALRVRNTLSAKAYQDQLVYYDNLTGLPNRKLFIDHLNREIDLAKRENKPLALLDIGPNLFDIRRCWLAFAAVDEELYFRSHFFTMKNMKDLKGLQC